MEDAGGWRHFFRFQLENNYYLKEMKLPLSVKDSIMESVAATAASDYWTVELMQPSPAGLSKDDRYVNMYFCVSEYVCLYVHLCACVCVCFASVYIYLYVSVIVPIVWCNAFIFQTCNFGYVFIFMCVFVCMFLCNYVCVYVCVWFYVFVFPSACIQTL